MHTISDIIDAFGGNTRFAELIGKKPSTASEMKRRGSIPVEYWPTLIRAAEGAGIQGITSERLMLMHANAAASVEAAE